MATPGNSTALNLRLTEGTFDHAPPCPAEFLRNGMAFEIKFDDSDQLIWEDPETGQACDRDTPGALSDDCHGIHQIFVYLNGMSRMMITASYVNRETPILHLEMSDEKPIEWEYEDWELCDVTEIGRRCKGIVLACCPTIDAAGSCGCHQHHLCPFQPAAVYPTHKGRWVCDACKQHQQGGKMWHCVSDGCFYDECIPCYSIRRLSRICGHPRQAATWLLKRKRPRSQ